jgi:hypothetical protein
MKIKEIANLEKYIFCECKKLLKKLLCAQKYGFPKDSQLHREYTNPKLDLHYTRFEAKALKLFF